MEKTARQLLLLSTYFNESIIRTVKLIKPYNIISTKMRQQALRKGILTVG